MKYYVSWRYREGDSSLESGEILVHRALFSNCVEPCIEAARLIQCNPYTFDVAVINSDTNEPVEWCAKIGRVIAREGSYSNDGR